MFARPRAVTVEAFAPSALPDFIANPAPILDPRPFGAAPGYGRLCLLDPAKAVVKSSGIALVYSESPCVARCRLRPRGANRLSSVAILFL